MRSSAVPAILSLVLLLVAHSTARAFTEDETGFVYFVDMQADPALPLTPADQLHYCSALAEASKRIWEATNGSHFVYRAEFFYNTGVPGGATDVSWTRGDCTPTGGAVVNMCDYKHTCAKQYITNAAGQLDATVYCRRPELTCRLSPTCFDGAASCPDYAKVRGSRCVDAGGQEVLRDPLELGWVLAHEFGHTIYDLPDEYISDFDNDTVLRNFSMCVGEDDTAGTEFTSIMGQWGRTHFCDQNTHVNQRFARGVNDELLVDALGQPFLVQRELLPGGAWDQMQSTLSFRHPLNYNSADAYSSVPPYPAQPFDCEWHFAVGQGPTQDALILLDKSGSMNYTHPLISGGPTALEAASSAAVSFHNQALSNRRIGVSAFDTVVTHVDPYGLRGPDLAPLTLTPSGLTDLCKAIRDGADLIRDRFQADGATESRGLQLLLTDGRPTTPGCNSDAQVLDAVLYACQATPGRISVATAPVGFGDADHELLRKVAEACGAAASALPTESVPSGGPSPAVLTTPLLVQAGLARSGKAARGLQEVASAKQVFASPAEQSFLVPPGTTELAVEWVGDGFDYFRLAGPDSTDPDVSCTFDDLAFELESPSGVIVTAGNRPVAGESAYLTRTIHLDSPQVGGWTARVVPNSAYACLANAPLPHAWGDHVPEVYVLASIRNGQIRATLDLPVQEVGRTGSVPVQAELWSSVDTRLTGIDVSVRMSYKSFEEQLALRDDGLGGDEHAGDGVYYGELNAAGVTLEPGEYVVEAEFTAEQAASRQFLVGDPIVAGSQPSNFPGVNVTLRANASVSVLDCSIAPGAADPCPVDRAIPLDRALEHPCLVSLNPGQSYTGLRVRTEGLAMGTGPVRLSAGIDVNISNVSHTYDATTGAGQVTFDAFVHPAAQAGPRELWVSYAGQSVRSSACLGTDIAPGVSAACFAAPSPSACCRSGQALSEGNAFSNLLWRPLAPNPDCIFGYGGYDTITSSSSNDFISGGSQDDGLYAGSGSDAVLGDDGHDLVKAGDGNDYVFGHGGHDILWGEGGHDWIFGGDDDDLLYGGSGNDRLEGGDRHDAIQGDYGDDLIRPGPGLDIVDAGFGNDRVEVLHACEYFLGKTLIGGFGNDVLVLPTTLLQALASGVIIVGFEHVVENETTNSGNSECAP